MVILAPFSFVFFVLLLLRCRAKRKKKNKIYSLSILPTENYIDTVHFFFLKKKTKKSFIQQQKNINEIPTSVCWASVFFAVFSPNIVVIMTTVLGSGQNGGRSTLKALQSQCPLTRSHIDFGKVHRTELHSPDKVSCSVLCAETQMQASVISNTLPHRRVSWNQYGSPGKKTDATLIENRRPVWTLLSTENKGPYFSESVQANTVRVVPLKSRSAVTPPIDEVNSWQGFNWLNFMSVTEPPAPI